jgi:hypothetical protein
MVWAKQAGNSTKDSGFAGAGGTEKDGPGLGELEVDVNLQRADVVA